MKDIPPNLISSQRFLDPVTIAEKIADKDFECAIVRLTVFGYDYQVLLDGHHSLAAALESDEDFTLHMIREIQREADSMDPIEFLDAHWNGEDWYFVATGRLVSF